MTKKNRTSANTGKKDAGMQKSSKGEDQSTGKCRKQPPAIQQYDNDENMDMMEKEIIESVKSYDRLMLSDDMINQILPSGYRIYYIIELECFYLDGITLQETGCCAGFQSPKFNSRPSAIKWWQRNRKLPSGVYDCFVLCERVLMYNDQIVEILSEEEIDLISMVNFDVGPQLETLESCN